MGTRYECRWLAAMFGLVALLATAPLAALTLFELVSGETADQVGRPVTPELIETPVSADHNAMAVYEYCNVACDQYFVTGSPQEIDALESGRMPGWQRKGDAQAFMAFSVPVRARHLPRAHADARPVCRFYIPPASHFLSASEEECNAVAAAHPEFVLETAAAFYAWLPDAATGKCPALFAKIGGFEFQPVYRLWNGRADTNHRLTASRHERATMIANGWIAEGYGDEGVAMCVPHWYQ